MPEIPRPELLLTVVEIAATLAFALSGILEAARKRMDVVGVAAVAFITAFGGGTLRDILLDKRPFFWVTHHGYVWLVLGLAVAGVLWLRVAHVALTERAMRLPDAIGMGLFSAVGTAQALDLGQPTIVAALMGVVTGVFGGVMRDILCNEIPTIFRDHRPYAVCSFAGAWTCIGAAAAGAPDWAMLLAATSVAAGLRLLSLAFEWRVPGWGASR